jgi:MYXO-CTERM domain-containing protein
MDKLMTWMRAGAIALLLAFGAVAAQPVTAQDTATEVATEAAEVVDDAVDTGEEDDDGFNDWGLLGLLGLAGLAGLFRRPQPVVHDTDRTGINTRV